MSRTIFVRYNYRVVIEREFIIDIGSSSIGACFLERIPNEKPTLSYVKRVPIGTGSDATRANIVEFTAQALQSVTKGYEQLGRPQVVHVVLASPWYTSRVRFVTSKAERPVRVSKSSVSKAVDAQSAQESANSVISGTPVESIVTQVYVNGYATRLHNTVNGTTLRLHVYESAADKQFLDGIRDAVHKVFPSVTVKFHTFPLAAFLVLRDIRDEENFTFIDAGGEVTDVAIVHRDSLRFIGSFPKGSNFFARSLSQGSGVADTMSRMSLYARGELSADEEANFRKAFDEAVKPWGEEYQKTIGTAQSDTAIPLTTFIAADMEELRWFGKALESVSGAFPARPILMSPDFFQAHVTLGESGVYDAFLSVEALYVFTKNRDTIR